MHAKDTQDSGMYRITGYGDFLLANRISYEYDFRGPRWVTRLLFAKEFAFLFPRAH